MKEGAIGDRVVEITKYIKMLAMEVMVIKLGICIGDSSQVGSDHVRMLAVMP